MKQLINKSRGESLDCVPHSSRLFVRVKIHQWSQRRNKLVESRSEYFLDSLSPKRHSALVDRHQRRESIKANLNADLNEWSIHNVYAIEFWDCLDCFSALCSVLLPVENWFLSFFLSFYCIARNHQHNEQRRDGEKNLHFVVFWFAELENFNFVFSPFTRRMGENFYFFCLPRRGWPNTYEKDFAFQPCLPLAKRVGPEIGQNKN